MVLMQSNKKEKVKIQITSLQFILCVTQIIFKDVSKSSYKNYAHCEYMALTIIEQARNTRQTVPIRQPA
jgi:hypothetical protein